MFFWEKKASRGHEDLECNRAGDEDVSLREAEDLSEYEALAKYIVTYHEPDQRRDDHDVPEKVAEYRRLGCWRAWKPFRKAVETSRNPRNPPEQFLEPDINKGLDSAAIEERRQRYGWNELAPEKTNKLLKLLSYFRGPILYVMELAALLAAVIRDWIDLGVILCILILNASVGFYQEKQAEDVVASLKGDIALRATVVRDGMEQQILAREIVPGDIIVIQEGETIPADAQLACDYSRPDDYEKFKKLKSEDRFEENNGSARGNSARDDQGDEDGARDNDAEEGVPLIACDQSALTGESLAADKLLRPEERPGGAL